MYKIGDNEETLKLRFKKLNEQAIELILMYERLKRETRDAIAKIQDMRESADRLAETLKQASELKWTKGFQFGYKRACEEVLELLGGK